MWFILIMWVVFVFDIGLILLKVELVILINLVYVVVIYSI